MPTLVLPQIGLISFCLIFPGYLLYRLKNHSHVIAWVAVVTVLDIFNSQIYMNLSALPILGMVVLPHLYSQRKILWENKAVKFLFIYLVFLFLLGLFYGFIHPWPDLTGERSLKDQAMARSILHFGRTVCEFAVIFYLVLRLESDRAKSAMVYYKFVFVSSVVLCLSAASERLLAFDFYHFFTGGRELFMPHRLRGFTYEPRGLSQNLAYAILLLPFSSFGKWKYALAPVFLIFAYALTISFSGVAVLALGILGFITLAILLFSKTSIPHLKLRLAIGVVAITIFFSVLYSILPASSVGYVRERFHFLQADSIAAKLEVFDAASINFLNHNPFYYIAGTGPGLIYLPASPYILERDNYIYHNRFDALPHMGLVLVLSNSGVIGLVLLLTAMLMGVLNNTNKRDPTFLVGCVLTGLFFIQIRYFFIFGLAALFARNPVAPANRV